MNFDNKVTHTKSGWSRAYLSRRLAEEKAKLTECETTSHPFRHAMIQGQLARIASIEHYLSQ